MSMKEVSYHFEGGIAEFVDSLNKARTPLHKDPGIRRAES